MTQTEEAKILTLESAIEEVVSSERAAKHLRANGFPTLGAVGKQGLSAAGAVRFVGLATTREIRAALASIVAEGGVVTSSDGEGEPAVEDLEIEECDRPLTLMSPMRHGRHVGLHLSWLPAYRRVLADGTAVVEETIWLQFDDGVCELDRYAWFMRKFHRDRAKVDAAIDEKKPWRVECAAYVKSFYRNYGTDFWIESD